MIIKVKDFGYDPTPATPLSSDALLEAVVLTIDGIDTNFEPSGTSLEVIYRLGDQLDKLSIKYQISAGASISINDTDLASRIVTVTSEDCTTSTIYTVTFTESETTSTTDIAIYAIKDSVTSEQLPITFGSANANICTASLRWFDNNTTYIDVNVDTNFTNTTVVELIAATLNTDPDSMNLFGQELLAFTLEESAFLDAAYVYLRISRQDAQTKWIRLTKATTEVTASWLDAVKRRFSDKWCSLFNNRILTSLITDSAELLTLESIQSIEDLKLALDVLSIEWVDLRIYVDEFIDEEATSTQFQLSTSKLTLFNQLSYKGLPLQSYDRLDIAFSKWLYKEINKHELSEQFEEVLAWLRHLHDDLFHVHDLKLARIDYLANSGLNCLLIISTRLLKHLISWLTWIRHVQVMNFAKYDVSVPTLDIMLYAVTSVYQNKTSSYQMQHDVALAALTFFENIEALKKSNDIITIGDW
jgi:hypothetical protein